jgi:N-acetylglutamate synthase-like GNAT family acetyltransferase
MPTAIRRAVPADAPAIADVFAASRATMAYLPRRAGDAPLAGTARDKETWVADRDGRIVGFAGLDGGWVEHIDVHPSRFNTGTGAKLFRQAAMQHPQGFQLWVFQQDTGARHFFERQGCALVRLTDGQDNDEKLPDALYLWPGTKG